MKMEKEEERKSNIGVQQEGGQEGGSHEVDPNGYRIEQRSETEQRSQTKEVREIEGRTEVSLKDSKEIKLEEVKSKETVRKATPEELRALLEAEFDGKDEVQLSKEITVEEFTRLETKHRKTVDGELKTDVTSSEEHKSDEVREGPQWLRQITSGHDEGQPSTESEPLHDAPTGKSQVAHLEASLPQVTVDVPLISISGSSNLEAVGPNISGNESKLSGDINTPTAGITLESSIENGRGKPKSTGVRGMFKKRKPTKSQSEENIGASAKLDEGASGGISMTNLKGVPEFHHEVKHKRHVIEEVIIEDCDKYYEKQEKHARTLPIPKLKKKLHSPKIVIQPTEERRRSTGDVLPMDVSPATGSVQNMSAQQVTFLVEYEKPSSKTDLRLPSAPKFNKEWNPFGKKTGIDTDVDVSLKRPHQDEIVVFDRKKKSETPEEITYVVEHEGHTDAKLPRIKDQVGAGVSLSLPDVKIKTSKQEEVIIDEPNIVTDKPSTGWKPHFGFKMPSQKAQMKLDADLPDPNAQSITFIVQGPQPTESLEAIESHEDKSGFRMPSIHMPDINFPSLKRSGKGPNAALSASADIEVPEAKTYVVEGNLPEANINIKGEGGIKVKGRKQEEQVIDGEYTVEDDTGFRMPTVSLPDINLPSLKFSGKAPKAKTGVDVSVPVADVDVSTEPEKITYVVQGELPSGHIKVKGRSQEELVVDGEHSHGGKFKMPSIHMPDINFPSLKRSGKGPTASLSGSTDIEVPESKTYIVEGDLSGANVNVKGEGGVKVKGRKQEEQVIDGEYTVEDDTGFRMPTVNLPDINLPSLKLSGTGPKTKAGTEVSVPVAGADLDVSTEPEKVTYVVEGHLPTGRVKVKGRSQEELVVDGEHSHEGKFKMPSIHMPDINFPSLKRSGKGPNASLSASADTDVPEAKTYVVEGDLPEGQVKIKADSNAKVKKGKQEELIFNGDYNVEDDSGFRMPSVSAPKLNFPSLTFSGKEQKAEADVNAPATGDETTNGLETITFVVQGDSHSGQRKVKKPPSQDGNQGEAEIQGESSFKMPSVHLPDIKFPTLKTKGKYVVQQGNSDESQSGKPTSPDSVTFISTHSIPEGNISVETGVPDISGTIKSSKPSWSFGARAHGADTAAVSNDKQEEVIVDDTHLHVDKSSSDWIPSLKLSGKAPQVVVSTETTATGQAELKHSTSSLASSNSETVTYVVTSDSPGGNIYAEKSKKPKGKENKWTAFGKKNKKDVPSVEISGQAYAKKPKQEEIVIGGPSKYPLASVNVEPNISAGAYAPQPQGNVIKYEVEYPVIDISGKGFEKSHKSKNKWNIFGKKSGEYNMNPELPDIPPVKLTHRMDKGNIGTGDINVAASANATDEVLLQLDEQQKKSIGLPSVNIDSHQEIQIPKYEASLSFESPEGHLNGVDDSGREIIYDDKLQMKSVDVNLSQPSLNGEVNLSTSTPKLKTAISPADYSVNVSSRLSQDDSTLDRRDATIKSDRPRSYLMPDHKFDHTYPRSLDATLDSSGSHQYLSRMYSPGDFSFDGQLRMNQPRPGSAQSTADDSSSIPNLPHFVVIAIDFGTTFSGYAFSFTHDTGSIHMMRKWEGGDPGVINQKTPTTLLLTPEGEFHSFGFTARDFYHDLSSKEARRWMYFEKFKMALHYSMELNSNTEIQAANGQTFRAISVFTHALRFFKEHALAEVSEQSGTRILNEDVRWVITVPAIWKAPAKQFMREAAYEAGIATPENPEQLLIALEPEAASIYIRKQRLRQLIPENLEEQAETPDRDETPEPVLLDQISFLTKPGSQTLPSSAMSLSFQRSSSPIYTAVSVGQDLDISDTRYMVADCGGGTVDITVYEMTYGSGKLKELYKATGGPFGSMGVDQEFEKLLVEIFGADLINSFKTKRPAGWIDFMLAFESRKRAANPFKSKPLNVSPPFSFIDYHKKFRNSTVEAAIRKYNSKDIRWSSQGMIRLMPEAMERLFEPTLVKVCEAIANVLNNPDVTGIKYIFLVGGFAESLMLQQATRVQFGNNVRILIPQDVSLTILKGAVLFGLDPGVVTVRKSRMSYGVSVLHKFIHGKHPPSHLAYKDNIEWCTDVFDPLVLTDQSVALGETVIRRYAPAGPTQTLSNFNIYSSKKKDVQFVTDKGVKKCGTLCLEFPQVEQPIQGRREVQARLTFGDTEIKIVALDVLTGKSVRSTIDFLNK